MRLNQNNNIIIGIDTSCYTTSIAAISLDKKVIFNEKILLQVKEGSKGLRQSEAVFQHVNNLGEISYKIDNILKEYCVRGICASTKPRPTEMSYMPVFNVGYNFAKLTASMLKCDLYETTHQENHIEASLFNSKIKNEEKFIAIHMSGGTTEILLVKKDKNKSNLEYNIDIVGGSNDISFGQLVDRIGVKLGYRFPAGKFLDEDAIKYNGKLDSGLKTSVRDGYMNLSGLENQIEKLIKEKDKGYIAKLTFDAIVRNIEKSIIYICEKYDINEVVLAGGVAASKYISNELQVRFKRKRISLYFTKPQYSTDNGVGCALIGVKNYEAKSLRNK